ncbi:zinc finger, C2H2 type protein [Rhizoctonia solani AG-3 Rhs1AP]|nr:zinc finger, C2H2 type protein [Rhizoctonia solani AG-3 Rhs1AP]KEP49059.1 zinc finger, C2H2 type protein [Rhizoctonia solani 123E]
MTPRAWIHRTATADDESDHQPSPLHAMYHEHSPADHWLSPAMTSNDDVDMIFDLDWNRSDAFCSLLDDTASHRERQALLNRWQTPVYSMPSLTKTHVLSRQPTLDNVVIASEWEEKLIRRWQRKNKKQHLSLREVKSQMPPLEFDPAFADSDTEDEDEEPAFNPESLREPLLRPVPAPIAIPQPTYVSAPLSPLTPLSEPPHSSISQFERPLSPAQAPAVPDSYVPPTPMSPVVKQEPVDDAIKRTLDDMDPELDAEADPEHRDDVVSEGEYMPSDDEEDDADPTYGAPKTRRASQSHARTPSTEKPVRTPGRRRRPVDDASPSQCTYINPLNQTRCQQIFARAPEMKRHIDHFHHEQEARAVIDGRLPRNLASLLGDTWDGTLGKPTCEGCGTEFSRRDAVKRHQNEVKAKFEDGRCVWCPGTQGRKGSAKRVALAKISTQSPTKRQRRK